MSWQQFFSVRFTYFANLAQLAAGVDSPLLLAAPRVQDAWIYVGIRSTSITQSVEPTTTMSSPSFNPAIGHSIWSDLVLPRWEHEETGEDTSSLLHKCRWIFSEDRHWWRQNTGFEHNEEIIVTFNVTEVVWFSEIHSVLGSAEDRYLTYMN